MFKIQNKEKYYEIVAPLTLGNVYTKKRLISEKCSATSEHVTSLIEWLKFQTANHLLLFKLLNWAKPFQSV